VAVAVLTRPMDPPIDDRWEPPRTIIVGGGPLPPGVREVVADDSVVLDSHQLDVLNRLPAPAVVLVTPAGTDPPAAAIVRGVRQRSGAPIIALLPASTEGDRIGVLRAGADDGVDADIGVGELLARIEAVSRRRLGTSTCASGGVTIDRLTREVWVGSLPLDLTRREFDLLAYLVASPRRVFSREQLLRTVWGSDDAAADPSTVTEHIRRLRSKLRGAGGSRDCIRTLRGVGYRFDPERCTAGCGPAGATRR
jgi:two-component system, OmpR family, response regulator RegX3